MIILLSFYVGGKLGEGQVATVYHDVLELEDVGMAALCPDAIRGKVLDLV